jgi:redox-sensitive bicupin YhaK (pirin superfamily)
MIYVRKSNERGLSNAGWLKSFHTFSFGEYYDTGFMGLGHLRVINEDTVQAAQGFGTHPHRDMEIISYVIEGELAHKDSLGTGSIIRPGEIQLMSAGTGVSHSEFNHYKTSPLHFLQIWIIPNQTGLKPGYQQIGIQKKPNQLVLIGSNEGRDGSIVIHQAVDLYVAYLMKGQTIGHGFKEGRQGWLQLIKGEVMLNGESLVAGDGAAVVDVDQIKVNASADAEMLLFDL